MTKRRTKSKKFTSSGITCLKMLSVLACFGAQPPCTKAFIQVYSKLGGMFIGSIQRPCLKKEVDAYLVLRKLQDQVATWLCHPKMPPRYLALFVGTLRLTSADFPFIDHVDAKSSRKVLDSLGKALRIEAMWDEDLTCAKNRLASRGLKLSGHDVTLMRDDGTHHKELLPMEVEACTFGDTIHDVWAWVRTHADTLGCIHMFPNLEKLSCGFLKEVDFERLSKLKTLSSLSIGVKYLNEDVGFMTSLEYLSAELTDVGCIPTTIGLLTKLTHLGLMGSFTGSIPREIGNLCGLTGLKIAKTQVSGSIPSEVCQLKKLTELDLSRNPRLGGSFPDEFCNLKLLTFLNLHDTPVETNGFLHSWQHHKICESESFWERQV